MKYQFDICISIILKLFGYYFFRAYFNFITKIFATIAVNKIGKIFYYCTSNFFQIINDDYKI